MSDRETIKVEVIKVLKRHTGKSDIKEFHHLTYDHEMPTNKKKVMALYYSEISSEYGGYTVTTNEAKKLKTVKESIDLVYEKANKIEEDNDE